MSPEQLLRLRKIAEGAGQQYATQDRPNQTPVLPAKGGFEDWISEAGGLGGAVAGGSAGFVVGGPIGGIIGAGLGGFGGGFGGSAVEQKVTTDNIDWNKALKEGAIEGVMSAGPIRLTKGAYAAGKAIAKGAGTEAAKQGAKKAMTTSLLSKTNQAAASNLSKAGSGMKVGENVGDINKLSQSQEVFNKYDISGTPTQQLKKINKTVGNLGQEVDDVLSKNPIKIDGRAVRSQIDQAASDPLKYADLDLTSPGVKNYLESHLSKFASANTGKDINDYIKVLNPISRRANDKIVRGVVPTDKEAAALAAKRAGDEVLSQIPEIKPLKQDMAILYERNPQVAALSEKTFGIPIAGIQSRSVKQGLAGAQSRTGDLLSSVNNKASNISNKIGPTGSIVARATMGGLANQTFNPTIQQGATEDLLSGMNSGGQPQLQNDLLGQANGSQVAGQTSYGSGETQVSKSDYLANAAMNAVQVGDIDTAKKLMALAESYSGLEQTSAKSTGSSRHGKPTAQQYAFAKSGVSTLTQLADYIQSNPDIVNKSALPGGDIPIIGGFVRGAGGLDQYDAYAYNLADTILRLKTGAQANESEIRLYQQQIMPRPGDRPSTIQSKLQQIYESLAPFLGND